MVLHGLLPDIMFVQFNAMHLYNLWGTFLEHSKRFD